MVRLTDVGHDQTTSTFEACSVEAWRLTLNTKPPLMYTPMRPRVGPVGAANASCRPVNVRLADRPIVPEKWVSPPANRALLAMPHVPVYLTADELSW